MVIKLALTSFVPIDMEMASKMELDKVASQFYHEHTHVDKSKHLYFVRISFGIKVLILGFFVGASFGFLHSQASQWDKKGGGDQGSHQLISEGQGRTSPIGSFDLSEKGDQA